MRTLITVCSPVLRALADVYSVVQALWLHLYGTGWSNRMQFLGQRVRLTWAMPEPAENRRLEGIGHSNLLRDPERFEAVYPTLVVLFLRGDV